MSAVVEEPGLFDLAELLPPTPPKFWPDVLLGCQDFTRPVLELLAQVNAWHEERANARDWKPSDWRTTHAWQPALCGPKPWLDVDLEGGCRITLWSVDLRCDPWDGHRERDQACECVGGYYFRWVCACGTPGTVHEDENAAVEAGLDHAWPGWRDLPLGPRFDYDGPPSGREKAVARWEEKAVAAGYDVEWLRTGGPIKTARGRWGGRHVPERTPHGGYDLGVLGDR